VLLAFLFTVAFKFPVVFIQYQHHTYADKVLIIADTLSALIMLFITSQQWKGAPQNE